MNILIIREELVHFFLGFQNKINKNSNFFNDFFSTYPTILNLKIFKYSRVYKKETYKKTAKYRNL